MGTISYDGLVVGVDDRTLTHLQIVIVNKLRKGEAFLMSWKDAVDVGAGRSSIWLHPYVLVHFRFSGGRVPSVNERWLQELTESADSSRGLVVTSEQGDVSSLPVAGRETGRVATVVSPRDPKPRDPKQRGPRLPSPDKP
jgi:hypothetical protein